MTKRLLSSEEYDERARKLQDDCDYEGALEILKEGLSLYPSAVELHVGLGYARLAREEFAWAQQAYERALVLDPGHEEALVGVGEALLRLGHRDQALLFFERVKTTGYDDDVDLMLTMGRALYREGMYSECRDVFANATTRRPDDAEAAAALGYTLHRLGDQVGAGRQIRLALRLNPKLHEARVYLSHLLYDLGDWESSLREFERVPPADHWDALAVWRTIELKRALCQLKEGDAQLLPWQARLRELEAVSDPLDLLLAEVETEFNGSRNQQACHPSQLELFDSGQEVGDVSHHQVRLPNGYVFQGPWHEIVRQMRDGAGFDHEPLARYMRRLAERWNEERGVEIPFQDPEAFIRAAIQEGLITLEDE